MVNEARHAAQDRPTGGQTQQHLRRHFAHANVDAFMIGDGESSLPELLQAVKQGREAGVVRGMQHHLSARTHLAIESGLRLRKRTETHLHAMTGNREYLVTRYGRIEALHGLSIQVRQGQLVALVGANGAGDAFAAGVLYGIHEGRTIRDSLTLGLCSAASALRSISTTSSVGTVAECLALADQWGWRQPI